MKTENTPESEGPSLRDTIANASGWGGGEGTRSDDAQTAEPAAKSISEDGAVARSEPAGADASVPKPARAADSSPAGVSAPVAPPAGAAAIAPPMGFKDLKAWETTPEFTKQFMRNRESQVMREVQKVKQAADFGTGAYRAIEPLMPTLRAQGVHPLKALQGMAQLITVLRSGTERERYEAFAGAAQEYGVDLRRLVEGLPSDSNQPSPEFADIQRRLDALDQREQAMQQQQMQEQAKWLWGHASSFMSKPEVAEFWPFVGEDVARIVESSLIDGTSEPDKILQEAFDLACLRNPSVRERRQQGSLARQAEETKRLRNAASVSSASSPIAGSTVPSDESLRGTLERAFAAAGAR